MNDAKYIGLDVHQATISVAVLDSAGNLVMEAILETKAEAILQFIHGLRGSLHVTFEEGTCAAWLHDLLKPHVAQVLVCDPRKNALIKAGNKSDRIDARKLADLLYLNKLNPVNYGETGIRALQEIPGHPRTEPKSQSRSEKYLQGSRDPGRCRPRAVSGVSCRSSSPRDEANDGASHPGTQDRGHHFDRLEERSTFRRRTSKTASSLSVCRESVPAFISTMAG